MNSVHQDDRAVVHFYNQRGPAQQWIKERKGATFWPAVCRLVRAPCAHRLAVVLPGSTETTFLGGHSMKDFSAIGDKTRREVLGEDWYRLNMENMTEFDRAWQIYATNTNWASTWSRNIIPRQTFSMINLAMLAAAGHFSEFELHFRNALLRTKVPLEQLRELMLHISQYCGQPTGAAIWKISRRVLKEEKVDLSQLEPLDVTHLYHLPD